MAGGVLPRLVRRRNGLLGPGARGGGNGVAGGWFYRVGTQALLVKALYRGRACCFAQSHCRGGGRHVDRQGVVGRPGGGEGAATGRHSGSDVVRLNRGRRDG